MRPLLCRGDKRKWVAGYGNAWFVVCGLWFVKEKNSSALSETRKFEGTAAQNCDGRNQRLMTLI